jgi:hypothetical protein
MDAGINKNNRMLSEQGNNVAKGVVDLRCFSRPRYHQTRQTEKVFHEVRTAKKPLDLRCYAEPRNFRPLDALAPQQEAPSRRQSERDSFAHRHRQSALGIEEAFQEKNALSPAQIKSGYAAWREKIKANLRPIPAQSAQPANTEQAAPIKQLPIKPSPALRTIDAASIRPTSTIPRPTFKASAARILPRLSLPKLEALLPQYHQRAFARFVVAAFLVPAIIFSFSFTQNQFEEKGRVLGASTAGYDSLKSAAAAAYASDFSTTDENFDNANLNFAKARETINNIGLGVGEAVGELPIETPISTAQNLTAAGENISLAGKDISEMLGSISDQMAGSDENNLSFAVMTGLGTNLQKASMHLKSANDNIQKVDVKYIPAAMQDKLKLAQAQLPGISRNFERLSDDYPAIVKMLGGAGAQKYLLLFENSSEMRATGGFIGSYGILDINAGKIDNLMVDGIFNPDGQLRDAIVPPMPIQKISANWSMHDSNWFADFPTSAKKTALFYEKTGGPTVDGVIAITPQVIESLLEITGPIEMPDYNLTLTKDNFLTATQDQVENLYDKNENQPKKILSDLAPLIIEKLFKDNSLNSEQRAQRLLSIIEKLEQALSEKNILIYHRDENIESMIEKRGWGGELIQNQQGDYLAVIDSNINGYKTDAVIDESIHLDTQIQTDGTIIDTLTVTRKHNGGNEKYDWYNRVNADYMRVYVPKGSILLEAKGNTIEEYQPPVDYKNFSTDPDVQAEESTIRIDPDSKTKIFEETGKTVFGNWVYVSPQEEVTVTYKYQLPFKANFDNFTKSADAYSAIVQKQAGSRGSSFTAKLSMPEKWQAAWRTSNIDDQMSVSEKLDRDLLYAGIFTYAH